MPGPYEHGMCGSQRAGYAAALISALAVAACDAGPEDVDWPYYLGDGSSQHSILDQITPANVHRLETAWTYRAGGGKIGTKSDDAYIAFALPEQ